MSDPVTLDMSKSQPLGSPVSGVPPQDGNAPTLDMSKSQPIGTDNSQTTPTTNAQTATDPNPDWVAMGGNSFTPRPTLHGLEDMGKGFVKGVLSTTTGLGNIIHKTGEAIHPGLGEAVIPQAGLNDEAAFADTHNNPTQNLGYGGETLTEFMLGDEALKGLSMADKLTTVAKWMKIAEKSPRIMQALKFGATAAKTTGELTAEDSALLRQYPKLAKFVSTATPVGKLATDAARAGLVQGGQTTVRTGGDITQGAEDAAKMAGTAGLIGGVTGAAGGLLSKAGDAAAKTADLAARVEGAASKPEVTEALGNRIDSAENALHTDYESGINNLTDRLGGNENSSQVGPLKDKAKSLLAEPIPGEHPDVSAAREGAGDLLKPKVKDFLANISKGELPVAEDVEQSPNSNGGLIDQYGKPIQSDAADTTGKPTPPRTIKDLIQLRQTVRSWANNFDYGDINARTLRQLIPGIDDEIGKMAQSSGDTNAVRDYQDLRQNYAKQINLYDDPLIKKIREGKVDDAAKDFVGVVRQGSALPSAGKTAYNTKVLRGIIGDDGMQSFGTDVFNSILKDANINGQFNPARFIDTWNRITPETKTDLFDMGNAQNGLDQLVKDAKSAANLQKVIKYATVLSGGGASAALGVGAGASTGILTAIGMLAAEGNSIRVGRDMLDWVATHPKAIGAVDLAGKAANSRVAQGLATTGKVAGKAAFNLNSDSNNPQQNVTPLTAPVVDMSKTLPTLNGTGATNPPSPYTSAADALGGSISSQTR